MKKRVCPVESQYLLIIKHNRQFINPASHSHTLSTHAGLHSTYKHTHTHPGTVHKKALITADTQHLTFLAISMNMTNNPLLPVMQKHTQHEKSARRGVNTLSNSHSFPLSDADSEINDQNF